MVYFPDPLASPFRRDGALLPRDKFSDPQTTLEGKERGFVPLEGLETLWFNTGTLCNLACATCYIESSPTNDALIYLTHAEVTRFLDEVEDNGLPTKLIGFTGGEPFMNREVIAMLEEALKRGFEILVLTNAMRPMRRFETELLSLLERYGDRLTMRVSLDHHTQAAHEAERGEDTWAKAIDGLRWLARHGFRIAIAGRQLAGETMQEATAGYRALLLELGIKLEIDDPEALVIFPEMDARLDTPEVSEECWDILGLKKESVMCSSSRMVVHRRGEKTARVVACTLLPYEDGFDLGADLTEAAGDVRLNHPHCSRFCVLGGASCGG
jgi:uncharacterized Fe-S cluster-containing radical SAM superfamily protein